MVNFFVYLYIIKQIVIMKTQTNIEAFNQSLERGKNVTITPFTPYVSKPYPTRKQCESKVEALKASIERARNNGN